ASRARRRTCAGASDVRCACSSRPRSSSSSTSPSPAPRASSRCSPRSSGPSRPRPTRRPPMLPMLTASTTDGLLLVDKPAGVSSHDVVGAARRTLREKRIGHAGTLDPFATGLLVLLVGRATRLLPHLPGEPKIYEARIRFGTETETEDLHGAVSREAPL